MVKADLTGVWIDVAKSRRDIWSFSLTDVVIGDNEEYLELTCVPCPSRFCNLGFDPSQQGKGLSRERVDNLLGKVVKNGRKDLTKVEVVAGLDKLRFKLEEQIVNAVLRGSGGVDRGTERLEVETSAIRDVGERGRFEA